MRGRGVRLVLIVSVLVALRAAPALAQTTVTGVVYADVDGDGAMSAADHPLVGAVVWWEDMTYTQTAADGSFTLDVPGAGIVWVRAPDGYSPRPVWTTVSATGANGLELGLKPRPVVLPLRFVHAADIHLGIVSASDVMEPLARAVRGEPHFVIGTGDLTHTSADEQFADLLTLVNSIDVPFVPGVGNHDWWDQGINYRATMGPTAYTFDADGVHFIVINGNAPVGERLAFIESDMALTPVGTLTLAFIHYPITLPYDQQLFEGLVANGVTHLFTGHYHSNRMFDFPGLREHNIQPLGMGGMQFIPAGYELVTVEDGEVHTKTKFVVNHPVVEVVHPRSGSCISGDFTSLIVAAELGPGHLVVRATVDGGRPLTLNSKGGWDYTTTLRRLDSGVHRLHVVATTPYETRHVDTRFCVADVPHDVAPRTSWTQMQGDARHHGAVETTIEPPLRVAWAQSVGGFVRGAPVLSGGRLFVPLVDFGTDASGGVVALDARTGKRLWTQRVGRSVHNTLVVDGDRVIAAAVDGVVRAFDVATGELAWQRDLGSDLPAQDREIYAAPTLLRPGVVVAGHQYRFAAIDTAIGDLRWQVTPSDATFMWPGQSTPVATDDTVVAMFDFGIEGVLAFDSQTGAQRWSYKDGRVTYGMEAPPAIDGDYVIVTKGDGTVIKLALADGKEVWRNKLFEGGSDYALWLRSSPAVAGDRYIIATQDGSVYAVAASDGSVLWAHAATSAGPLRTTHQRATADGFSGAPLITGELVWIGGDDGVLRALRRATGELVWSVDLGVPIVSGVVPALPGAAGLPVLYVTSWDGTVRAMTARGIRPARPTGQDATVTVPPGHHTTPSGSSGGCQSDGSPGASVVLLIALFAIARGRIRP